MSSVLRPILSEINNVNNHPHDENRVSSMKPSNNSSKKIGFKKKATHFKIFEDHVQQKHEVCNAEVQVDLLSEFLLTDDEATSEYWRQLADERQAVLSETLVEREQLKEQNQRLQEENTELRQDLNSSLLLIEVYKNLLDNESETLVRNDADAIQEDTDSLSEGETEDAEHDNHADNDCTDSEIPL